MPDDGAFVRIASFTTVFEASVARGALEAAGIAAVVPGERVGTFARGQTVSADLFVRAGDRDEAIAALRRLEMRLVDR